MLSFYSLSETSERSTTVFYVVLDVLFYPIFELNLILNYMRMKFYSHVIIIRNSIVKEIFHARL